MDCCSAIVYYGGEYLSISPALPEIYQNNSISYFNDHCKFNMRSMLLNVPKKDLTIVYPQ